MGPVVSVGQTTARGARWRDVSGLQLYKETGVTEVGQTTPFSGQVGRRLEVFESATRARSLGERDGSARRPHAPHSQSDGYVELKSHFHIHPSSPSLKGRSDDLKYKMSNRASGSSESTPSHIHPALSISTLPLPLPPLHFRFHPSTSTLPLPPFHFRPSTSASTLPLPPFHFCFRHSTSTLPSPLTTSALLLPLPPFHSRPSTSVFAIPLPSFHFTRQPTIL